MPEYRFNTGVGVGFGRAQQFSMGGTPHPNWTGRPGVDPVMYEPRMVHIGTGVGDCQPGAPPECTDVFGSDAPMKARMISRPGTRMRQGFYLGIGRTAVVGARAGRGPGGRRPRRAGSRLGANPVWLQKKRRSIAIGVGQ